MDSTTIKDAAARLLHKEIDELTELEHRILRKHAERKTVSRTPAEIFDERTFGERVADRVAEFGGSWTFIIIFFLLLASWVVLNTYILARRGEAFDPYPYILLNLFLSMLASIQAPIIMMSQNRQAAKDRLAAQHDYEVNLKAEFEILSLHEKLDDLREQKWLELVKIQQLQIDLLEELAGKKT